MKSFDLFIKHQKQITSSINKNLRDNSVHALLLIFTELGSSIGAGFIFFILSLFSGFEIWLLFPIYLTQLILVEVIKKVYKRPRPKGHLENKNIFGMKASSGSFPSGHASNAFTMAVLFSYYYNLNIVGILILFIFVLAISLSRIYLKKHFIVDVIGGALLGITITYFALYLL